MFSNNSLAVFSKTLINIVGFFLQKKKMGTMNKAEE